MALSTFVGSFTVPAATGNKAVTGVGFQGKVIIFWGDARSADGASSSAVSSTTAPWYIGYAISSSSRVVMTNGDTFTGTNVSATDATKCVALVAGTTVSWAADFVSFDADGFTVNFTTANATAYVVNFTVLGGVDLTNAAIKSFTTATATGSQAYTGVGFKPDSMMMLAAEDLGAANIQISTMVGVASGASARGVTTSNYNLATGTYQRVNQVFAMLSATTVRREADLTTLDADGFTLNWTTANAATVAAYSLCLKGGQFNVGNLTQKTSTGSQATTGVGFRPTGIWMHHGNKTAGTTAVSLIDLGIGSASGAANRGTVFFNDNNFIVSEMDRAALYTSRADDVTPTLQGKADLTSFDADGFTLNYGTADATAREIIYFAIGSAASVALLAGPGLRVRQAVKRASSF